MSVQRRCKVNKMSATNPIEIREQILKIALDNEYKAYETYQKVVERFGNNPPFSHIVEAEKRHIEALLSLHQAYGVMPSPNQWSGMISIPSSFEACCALGVQAEIENIELYDYLLGFAVEADTRDVLYRLQAASYNNHLPAFKQCLSGTPQMEEKNSLNFLEKIDTQVVSKMMQGQMGKEDIGKLISSANLSFLGGALLGGLGIFILQEMMNQPKKES